MWQTSKENKLNYYKEKNKIATIDVENDYDEEIEVTENKLTLYRTKPKIELDSSGILKLYADSTISSYPEILSTSKNLKFYINNLDMNDTTANFYNISTSSSDTTLNIKHYATSPSVKLRFWRGDPTAYNDFIIISDGDGLSLWEGYSTRYPNDLGQRLFNLYLHNKPSFTFYFGGNRDSSYFTHYADNNNVNFYRCVGIHNDDPGCEAILFDSYWELQTTDTFKNLRDGFLGAAIAKHSGGIRFLTSPDSNQGTVLTNKFEIKNDGSIFAYNLNVGGDVPIYLDSSTNEICRQTSSIKYKNIIEKYKIDTSFIDVIPIYKFTYKNKKNSRYHVGITAEDLYKYTNKNEIAIIRDKNNEIDGINFNYLIFALIQRCRELSNEVRKMKKEIETLKNNFKELNDKLGKNTQFLKNQFNNILKALNEED